MVSSRVPFPPEEIRGVQSLEITSKRFPLEEYPVQGVPPRGSLKKGTPPSGTRRWPLHEVNARWGP